MRTTITVLYMLFFFTCNALAQPSSMSEGLSACLPLVAKDKYIGNRKISTTLVLLDNTSQEEFNKAESSASGSATFNYAGIPLPAGANYKQFQDAAKAFKDEHQVSYSNSSAEEWFVENTTDAGFTACRQCLQDARHDADGIYIDFRFLPGSRGQFDYTRGLVHVKWRTSAAGKFKIKLYSSRGSIVPAPGLSSSSSIEPALFKMSTSKPIVIPVGQIFEHSFEFQRSNTIEAGLIFAYVEGYGKGDQVTVDPRPQIYAETGVRKMRTGQPVTIAAGGIQDSSNQVCVESGGPDWRLTGEPSFDGLQRPKPNSCDGCDASPIGITLSTPRRMCRGFHYKIQPAGGVFTATSSAQDVQYGWRAE